MGIVRAYRNIFIRKKTDIFFLLLLGVVASFPLEKINPVFIFILFSTQIGYLIYYRKVEFTPTFFLWLLIALFALNFLGLLYSEDLSRGFTMITRQISFVLFPLLYAVYHIRNISILFKTYVAAIFCFILICELETLYRFFYMSDVFPLNLELFLSYRYTGAELTKVIGVHNSYFGMYIMFSNVLIISFLQKVKKNFVLLLSLLLIGFQSVFILQMVAKTAIIMNTVIVISSLVYFLIKLKKIKLLVFLIGLVLSLGWFSVKHLDLPLNRIADRYMELKNGDSTNRDTRVKMWKSAVPIIKEHYMFGVGTGDVENVLHKEYKIKNIQSRSNVHNQYLDYFMRFGVLGIVIFLSVLGVALYTAIKTKNYVYFCFTIIIIGCCMTENILSRQWGITFYACFNYLLYISQKINK
tara:strand:- start:28924 stop:30156 length:1233 start_codon:yes stop_codon:yes gene_type:complete